MVVSGIVSSASGFVTSFRSFVSALSPSAMTGFTLHPSQQARSHKAEKTSIKPYNLCCELFLHTDLFHTCPIIDMLQQHLHPFPLCVLGNVPASAQLHICNRVIYFGCHSVHMTALFCNLLCCVQMVSHLRCYHIAASCMTI